MAPASRSTSGGLGEAGSGENIASFNTIFNLIDSAFIYFLIQFTKLDHSLTSLPPPYRTNPSESHVLTSHHTTSQKSTQNIPSHGGNIIIAISTSTTTPRTPRTFTPPVPHLPRHRPRPPPAKGPLAPPRPPPRPLRQGLPQVAAARQCAVPVCAAGFAGGGCAAGWRGYL
jgi:hypothetical protein